MNKLQRLIAIFLIGILPIGLFGCGQGTPTDVVNKYFKEIKAGNNEEVSELLNNQLDNRDKKVDKQEKMPTDEEKMMVELMEKLDAKVNSEQINGEKATVSVTVKGPNFSKMLFETMGKAMEAAFSGKEVGEGEANKMMIDAMKNPTIDERTADISLEKINNKWQITPNQELFTLILGNSDIAFDQNINN